MGDVGGHVIAITTGIVGSIVSAGTWLLGQTPSGGSDFGPWAQAGGTATAVGALAYVAKLLADGRLVAQPISELAASAREREEALRKLVESSHDREETLRLLLIHDQQNRREQGR